MKHSKAYEIPVAAGHHYWIIMDGQLTIGKCSFRERFGRWAWEIVGNDEIFSENDVDRVIEEIRQPRVT